MSMQNVKAGRAYVEIAADSTRLGRDLRSAQTQIKGFADSLRGIGSQVATFLSGAAIGGGIFGAAKSFADAGSALDDLSQRSGASVEALSALTLAAKLSDTSMESVGRGFAKMQQLIVKAAKGGDEAVATLKSLKLNVRSLARLSPEKQFEQIADAISKIQDPALRTTAAVGVFGKTGVDLIPLLNEGKNGLQRFRVEAESLGLVMSTRDAQSAVVFGDALDKLRLTLVGLYNKIGAALAPMLTRLTDLFSRVSGAVAKWLDRNRPIVALVAPIVAALGSAGAAAIGLGLAFKIAAIAIGPAVVATFTAVATAVSAVVTGFLAVAAPAAAVIAAIGGLTATMYALGVTWSDVATFIANRWSQVMAFLGKSLNPVGQFIANWVGKIVDGFAWMYSGATQYFGAIGKALSDGNLEGAGTVAMAGLKRAFRGGFNTIYGYYLAFIEGWKYSWDAWTTGLSQSFIFAWYKSESAFTDTIAFLQKLWTAFSLGLTLTWNDTIGFIQKAWVRLKAMFDKDINVSEVTAGIDSGTSAANQKAIDEGKQTVQAREKERQARQNQLLADSATMISGLEADKMRRQREREKETNKLMDRANAEFDKAKQDYEAAIKSVQKFKPVFNARKNKFGFDSDSLDSDSLSGDSLRSSFDAAQQRVDTKGSFSAAAAVGLAASDSLNKSAADTARNTAEMLRLMRNGGFVFT